MPKFSEKSLSRLEQADERLQRICHEAIKEIDFVVSYSYRTSQEQFELYKKGRRLESGKWVKVGKTVTDKDGKINRSYHNYLPSYAVDLVPYPVDWKDINRFIELSKVIKRIAAKLEIEIEWGGDWKMKDMPHYQIPKKNWDA